MAAARRKAAPSRADRVIAFIECLAVPEGKLRGQPIRLESFQVKWIRAVYREKHGRRVVRRAILSLARKNGKSTLMAAIALVHLVGPEAIENGQIISAGNDTDQAAVVFNLAAIMVRADPELMSMVNIIDSTKRMVCWHNGNVYRAISAEADKKHGKSPVVYIYDELAQAKNRDLFDALDTAQGAHDEPLGIIISTQSNDPQHPLSEMIDDGLRGDDESIVCHLYAVPDEEEDIYDEKVWRLANPGLGTVRSLEDMRAMARRASRMPSFENTFRNLALNQRVTRMTTLISKTDWKACAGEVVFEDGEEVILSLDLATTTDLACLGMIAVNGKARFHPWFWKPALMIEEHAKRDRFRYDLHAKAGLLELSDGRTINTGDIARKIEWCLEHYKVVGLVYDPHRIEYLKKDLDALGIEVVEMKPDEEDTSDDSAGRLRLFPWRQGFISMAPALDALETLVLNYELVHPAHPILTWNIANAVVSTDPAGNRKFDKQLSRLRIDGAQALAMAAGKRSQMINRGGAPSFWEAA
jgi:phage terminase large subunit-like protein